jgi:hypothetical protein
MIRDVEFAVNPVLLQKGVTVNYGPIALAFPGAAVDEMIGGHRR